MFSIKKFFIAFFKKQDFDFDNKARFVHQMFNNLAKDYDRMNNIISFGRHNSIKKQVIENVPLDDNSQVLDICTGTGDIAILIAQRLNKSGKVTGIDFSANMLELAKQKAKDIKNIEFLEADALNLPFEDETFDAAFISFGLRNLADLKKGLLEMKRVTKKGGYIVNLDFGKPKGKANKLLRLYFSIFVPFLGRIFNKSNFYQYLPESNNRFPSQDELVKILKELGLSEVKNYNFAFGLLAQQVAKV